MCDSAAVAADWPVLLVQRSPGKGSLAQPGPRAGVPKRWGKPSAAAVHTLFSQRYFQKYLEVGGLPAGVFRVEVFFSRWVSGFHNLDYFLSTAAVCDSLFAGVCCVCLIAGSFIFWVSKHYHFYRVRFSKLHVCDGLICIIINILG